MPQLRVQARRVSASYTHEVRMRTHQLLADEPVASGGDDRGPNPQELLAAALASCTAITMELYAERKGWDLSGLRVDCEFTPAARGCPTRFSLVTHMPAHLDAEQVARLQVIGAKCPVHRTLEGEVAFDERVALLPAAPAEPVRG